MSYQIDCLNKKCTFHDSQNKCGRAKDTGPNDYDIVMLGPDGKCINFTPKPEKE